MSKKQWNALKLGLRLALVIAAALYAWQGASHPRQPVQGQNVLMFDFLDVGQGDSILITSPSGYQLLIDGGPNQNVLTQLRSVMKAGDTSIDMVMLTHPDADHIFGLVDVLRDYRISTILMPAVTKDTGVYRAFVQAVEAEQAEVIIADQQRVMELPDGVRLQLLHPSPETYHQGEPANDASIVARLEYGQRSFLFTGDIEQGIEQRLVALYPNLLDVDVLKVPHHGSKTSSTLAFLEATTPDIAVIQVGRDNKYHHPAPLVLERYEKKQIRVFRTDLLGLVRLKTDGMSIDSEEPCPIWQAVFSCPSETVYTRGVER